ncbi:MAG: SymE family type I addiction module toxin [Nostochopsis sp.]
MVERKLKVYSSYRSNDKKAVPEIRLIGQWIEALGFEIGAPVKVTVREQLLIIEPLKDQADGNH